MELAAVGNLTPTQWAYVGTTVVAILQLALLPHLLAQRNKSPNATLAWLWGILLFPGLGGIVYLLLGSERVHRKHLARVEDLSLKAGPSPCIRHGSCLSTTLPELERINGVTPTGGNAVDLLIDGAAFFPALLAAIATARDHLHLEFYAWHADETGKTVRDALVRAAQRGVTVRVLADEIGSLRTFRSFFRPLVDAGGQFSWFQTFAPRRGRLHLNLRNHRKLVIVDGEIALTGGMNIGDPYWGKSFPHERGYGDVQLQLRGPVVAQLARVFAEDWYFAAGEALADTARFYPAAEPDGEADFQVIPGGPDNNINEIQLSVLAMIHHAAQRIRLVTPYFVPEESVVAALQLAAMRGVTVELIVPARGDHFYLTHVTRSYFSDLLPHGVRIFEYQPRLLHAKVGIFDDVRGMCGSANLDVRSLRINFELNVAFHGPALASKLNAWFEECLGECREVNVREHEARGLWPRIAEVICRPLTSLL
jgi:cardiolipin synthase A/B